MFLQMKFLMVIHYVYLLLNFNVIFESLADMKSNLKIDVKEKPESCNRKSKKGDALHVHYKGSLADGTEFDSSYNRNQPFIFTIGAGQVIGGWESGLLNMCEGEIRQLIIPPELGYGDRGAPPVIPPHSTLHFEVKLLKIDRPTNEL
ncbi:Peptidyl-prolyl cis-trans isomerase FKBP2 [Trichinella spiralis]|uniref:Peptidyl-prolyl cis-trans isomerase FKBP2 n=2 Tax=Trichinella spiralis TaxID=6334 RepID=A0ABR3K907_TRISP|nr:FK506-binding protein 2 [Trichinella spiralis]KRY36838.1 Peptidyl-prolyl cis-trans isomerase FKBP2 [Trichinella spiralis]